MGSLKSANSTAVSWNAIEKPPYPSGYDPVMALAQNHIHFLNVNGDSPGTARIFVIHCKLHFQSERSSSYVNQSPGSNLIPSPTLVTRRSPWRMDRPLRSLWKPGFNKNLLTFPTTTPQPTSLMLKTTARRPSLPLQSRTPSLLTSPVSRLSSSSIQLARFTSFRMYPAMTVVPTPVPLGATSRPSLPLPLQTSTPIRPPIPIKTTPPAVVLLPPAHQLTQTRTGLCQITPSPLVLLDFLSCSPYWAPFDDQANPIFVIAV